jgi:4-hydroxy-3-methylbut-2-enyl diphosphate reductase
VVGGYNSSNTSHIVELCEEKFPTYFISAEKEIISRTKINHFNFHTQTHCSTENYFPNKEIVNIILTSGASCPDAVVERVMLKLVSFFENTKSPTDVMKDIIQIN